MMFVFEKQFFMQLDRVGTSKAPPGAYYAALSQ